MLIEEMLPNVNLEDTRVEFKARLEHGLDRHGEDNELKWLREISAFANGKGGVIYVGVNDKTHEIEPLTHEESDKTIQSLYQTIETRIEPKVVPQIDVLPLPGTVPSRYLISIGIPSSKILPVYVHVNGLPACFVRQFGRAKIASPEEIATMVLSSDHVSYDQRKTDRVFRADDFAVFLRRYQNQTGKDAPSKDELELIGFLDEDGRVSKGGALFADDCQDEITTVKVSKYPGLTTGSDTLLAERTFRGPICSTIDQSITFIEAVSSNGYRKLAAGRKTLKAYPSRSLLEGIANAFAHRNYFLEGSFIEINLFVDRLEIVSPGALLGGRSFAKNKDITSIHPKHRNPVIAGILTLLRYIEAKGTGFDKIAMDYEATDDVHKPYVSSDSDSFTLMLPDLSYDRGVIGDDNPYPTIHLIEKVVSDYDEQILSCCYARARSLTEIASFLGIAPSTYLRVKILEPLVNEGYLASYKSGKAMMYVTVKSKLDAVFALIS